MVSLVLIVGREATLGVGAEAGTAEAGAGAGAVPPAVTKATGKLATCLHCGLCERSGVAVESCGILDWLIFSPSFFFPEARDFFLAVARTTVLPERGKGSGRKRLHDRSLHSPRYSLLNLSSRLHSSLDLGQSSGCVHCLEGPKGKKWGGGRPPNAAFPATFPLWPLRCFPVLQLQFPTTCLPCPPRPLPSHCLASRAPQRDCVQLKLLESNRL